jgi:hypothetical protein
MASFVNPQMLVALSSLANEQNKDEFNNVEES